MRPCTYCEASIYWKVIGGRPVPHNPAGDRHQCRPKVKEPFRTEKGPTITGALYRPSCGQCVLPAWELCGCSS